MTVQLASAILAYSQYKQTMTEICISLHAAHAFGVIGKRLPLHASRSIKYLLHLVLREKDCESLEDFPRGDLLSDIL